MLACMNPIYENVQALYLLDDDLLGKESKYLDVQIMPCLISYVTVNTEANLVDCVFCQAL